MSLKPSRHAKCGNPECRERFEKRTPWQKVCEKDGCAEAYVKHQKALAAAKAKRAERKARSLERKADKERKDQLKTRKEWIADVQIAFNAFIRFRDKDLPCICCDKPLLMIRPGLRGGRFDAGHYRSVGSAPHLRFDERNCHAQRKQCNREGAGRAVDYRRGLIARIGLAAVEELEADQSVAKWTIEDLKAMKKTYQAKLKELKKGEGR